MKVFSQTQSKNEFRSSKNLRTNKSSNNGRKYKGKQMYITAKEASPKKVPCNHPHQSTIAYSTDYPTINLEDNKSHSRHDKQINDCEILKRQMRGNINEIIFNCKSSSDTTESSMNGGQPRQWPSLNPHRKHIEFQRLQAKFGLKSKLDKSLVLGINTTDWATDCNWAVKFKVLHVLKKAPTEKSLDRQSTIETGGSNVGATISKPDQFHKAESEQRDQPVAPLDVTDGKESIL